MKTTQVYERLKNPQPSECGPNTRWQLCRSLQAGADNQKTVKDKPEKHRHVYHHCRAESTSNIWQENNIAALKKRVEPVLIVNLENLMMTESRQWHTQKIAVATNKSAHTHTNRNIQIQIANGKYLVTWFPESWLWFGIERRNKHRGEGCLAHYDEQVVEINAGAMTGLFRFSHVHSTIVSTMTWN